MGKRFRFLLSILVALFLIGGVPSVAQATVQPDPDQMAVYLNGDFSRETGSGNILGDLYTANGDLSFGGGPPEFTGTFYHKTGTAFTYPSGGWEGFDSRSQELDVTSFNAEFPDLAPKPSITQPGGVISNQSSTQTISSDSYYETFSISKDTSNKKNIVFDVSNSDITVVINTLNLSGDDEIIITGTGKIFLYIENITGSANFWMGGSNPNQVYIVTNDYIPLKPNVPPFYGNIIYTGTDSWNMPTNTTINGSLITNGTSVTMPQQTIINGLLYAPNASVEMTSDAKVMGRLVAYSLDMVNSNALIEYSATNSTLNIPSVLLAPEPETYTVNVTVDPTGAGTVTPTYAEVEEGQSINIQATPNVGYEFTHFTSTVSSMVPDGAGNVTVAGDVTITAHFQPIVIDDGYVNGILGEYYDEAELQNYSALRLRRIDPSVNFNFGYDVPDPSMEPETFSIRWTGYIKPSVSGNYTFKTYSDDGVRVFIDGDSVINNWGHLSLAFSVSDTPVYLEAGTYYPITVEYQQLPLYAGVFLFWQSDSVPMSLIPEANYFVLEETYNSYSTTQYYNTLDRSGEGFQSVFYEVDQNGNISSTPGNETVGQVYYEWGGEAPTGISTDSFYGEISGYLEAKFTEDVTLVFSVDDSIRVWLNDTQVINEWGWNSREDFTHTFSATAGQRYKIDIEYMERGLGATLIMGWRGLALGAETVPIEYMYLE